MDRSRYWCGNHWCGNDRCGNLLCGNDRCGNHCGSNHWSGNHWCRNGRCGDDCSGRCNVRLAVVGHLVACEIVVARAWSEDWRSCFLSDGRSRFTVPSSGLDLVRVVLGSQNGSRKNNGSLLVRVDKVDPLRVALVAQMVILTNSCARDERVSWIRNWLVFASLFNNFPVRSALVSSESEADIFLAVGCLAAAGPARPIPFAAFTHVTSSCINFSDTISTNNAESSSIVATVAISRSGHGSNSA